MKPRGLGQARLFKRAIGAQQGLDAIPDLIRTGIIGVARIDNLLIEWFNEHRTPELRHEDPEREHDHRDLLALTGVPVRPTQSPPNRF